MSTSTTKRPATIKIPDSVLIDNDLKPTSKLVYFAILRESNKKRSVVTHEELKLITGINSISTISLALVELRNRGLIETERDKRRNKFIIKEI